MLLVAFCCYSHADVIRTSLNDSDVVILTNADVKAGELSLSSLRAIFAVRKRSWEDQTPIKVYVLADNSLLHQQFCKSILKVYPYVLREQWDRLLFSGTGIPPTVVNSAEELLAQVGATSGAIGYGFAGISEDAANFKNSPPKSLALEPPASAK